jgi:hypothetical protein
MAIVVLGWRQRVRTLFLLAQKAAFMWPAVAGRGLLPGAKPRRQLDPDELSPSRAPAMAAAWPPSLAIRGPAAARGRAIQSSGIRPAPRSRGLVGRLRSVESQVNCPES